MRDGDQYECCCNCGTEYLIRGMYEVATGIYQCARCWRIDNDLDDEEDDDRDD